MIVSSFGWGLCWYKLKGCHFWNLWKCTHLDLQTVFRRMSNSKALDQVTSCSNLFVGENAGLSPLRKTGILPEIWGTVPRSSAVEAMFLGLIAAANRWFGAMGCLRFSPGCLHQTPSRQSCGSPEFFLRFTDRGRGASHLSRCNRDKSQNVEQTRRTAVFFWKNCFETYINQTGSKRHLHNWPETGRLPCFFLEFHLVSEQ